MKLRLGCACEFSKHSESIQKNYHYLYCSLVFKKCRANPKLRRLKVFGGAWSAQPRAGASGLTARGTCVLPGSDPHAAEVQVGACGLGRTTDRGAVRAFVEATSSLIAKRSSHMCAGLRRHNLNAAAALAVTPTEVRVGFKLH
jgi:hypothetical protein